MSRAAARFELVCLKVVGSSLKVLSLGKCGVFKVKFA